MPKGSKPGERRGGRQKGTPNKATADVQAAARGYTEEALDTLATIMRDAAAPHAARAMASNHLLDRGHGKPAQTTAHTGPTGEGPIEHKIEVRFVRAQD